MFFNDHYGILEWLEPKEYYKDAWKFLETAVGEDGEKYDIVIKGNYPCELKYTNIE